ncbi:Uncharacterized protein Adt_07316 [Abeliophyllum distichum]|uniref:Uncharacterized protein n=1 Tax=Abeliophyllum distichum TaxID=126358 RepID=A0ABD1V9E3_9LAMI
MSISLLQTYQIEINFETISQGGYLKVLINHHQTQVDQSSLEFAYADIRADHMHTDRHWIIDKKQQIRSLYRKIRFLLKFVENYSLEKSSDDENVWKDRSKMQHIKQNISLNSIFQVKFFWNRKVSSSGDLCCPNLIPATKNHVLGHKFEDLEEVMNESTTKRILCLLVHQDFSIEGRIPYGGI